MLVMVYFLVERRVEELEAKGVEHEAFVMDDLCPSGDLPKEIIKGLKGAFKRANARCYAYVSAYRLLRQLIPPSCVTISDT